MIKTNLAFGLRAIGLPLILALALALILGLAAGSSAPLERPAVTATR
jgi:hypothetical protein